MCKQYMADFLSLIVDLLVVKYNVRSPDDARRKSKVRHGTVIVRVPRQQFVLPALQCDQTGSKCVIYFFKWIGGYES